MHRTQAPPVVSLGSNPVVAPVARTGGQLVSGGFIVEGLQLFELTHLSASQATWLTIAIGIILAGIQNAIESHQGRQLLGRAPAPAVRPPDRV